MDGRKAAEHTGKRGNANGNKPNPQKSALKKPVQKTLAPRPSHPVKKPLRPANAKPHAVKAATAKKAVDPLLNPEEFERRNRIKEIQRNRRHLVYAVMVVFLTFYIVISLIIFVYYYFSFNSVFDETVIYSVKMVNQKGKAIASESASKANNDYGLYVSLSDLDTLCDLSVAGDGNKLTIILRKSGESLDCFTNSSFIYVNGTPARLSIPVLYIDRDYYFPVELIEQYLIGVDIKYDKGVCTMSLADGSDTVLELKLKSQPVSDIVEEPSETSDTSEESSENESSASESSNVMG